MTDLVSRLLEAIGEAEREARERRGIWPRPSVQDTGAVWLHIKRGGQAVVVHYPYPGAGYGDMADLKAWAEAEHGQDEDAVLRRCAADRKLVELHSRMTIMPGHPYFNDAHLTQEPMSLCRSCEPQTQWRRERSWPCRTILTLAESYGLSDHQEGEE